MNNDLISRSALLVVPNVCKVTEYDESGCGISYLAVSVDAIEAAPAVDAEPVRHGRWIEVVTYDQDGDCLEVEYICSECGRFEGLDDEPYCNCGAKMDGDVDGIERKM